MFLVCGMYASGKTTYAMDFAIKNNYAYLSSDIMYNRMSQRTDMSEDELRAHFKFPVWNSFWVAIYFAYLENKDIVVDTSALKASYREDFLDWFPGFEHHMIFIDADFELCLENNRERKRQIPEDVMEDAFWNYEDPEDEADCFDPRWITYRRIRNNDNQFYLEKIVVNAQ